MGLQSLKPIASRKLAQAGVLIALLATFNFLTLPGLLEQYSFWRDEIFTAAFISDSWGQLFTQWIGPDVHPPLYFILAKAWADQLGTSELSLRSLSYLASTGTIALLWWDWVKNQRLQRLLALVLVTASPTFLYYSQEARSYSFLLLGCCGLFLSIFYKHNLAKEKIDLPVHNQQRQYASTLTVYLLCLSISLIHYFGFILAAWILFIDLFDRKINSNRLQSISAFFAYLPLANLPYWISRKSWRCATRKTWQSHRHLQAILWDRRGFHLRKLSLCTYWYYHLKRPNHKFNNDRDFPVCVKAQTCSAYSQQSRKKPTRLKLLSTFNA